MYVCFFLLATANTTTPDIGTAAVRAFFVLIVLVIVLVLTARYGRTWIKRLLPRPQGEMRIVDTLHLEPRRTLYMIRLRNRDFLVASHENGLELLREFSPPTDTNTPDSQTPVNTSKVPENENA